MNQDNKCLIWRSSVQNVTFNNYRYFVENSPRAGGNYVITWDAKDMIEDNEVTDDQRARLTTLLVEQRRLGNEWPMVTTSLIEAARSATPLQVQERADRILRYISESSFNKIGKWVPILDVVNPTYETGLARSESTGFTELVYLCNYLSQNNWIELPLHIDGSPRAEAMVTIEGYSRIEKKRTNLDSSQVFIAMWFHDSTDEALVNGIEPAIRDAGYRPFRVDQKEHINKIEDEIIAEIRQSKFVVADFTHGEDGARGGVYYEAGFAHGLDRPVIFTCRNDAVEKLHFDTEHYNHIVWASPEELREKLKNRILAVIGEGPETPLNS